MTNSVKEVNKICLDNYDPVSDHTPRTHFSNEWKLNKVLIKKNKKHIEEAGLFAHFEEKKKNILNFSEVLNCKMPNSYPSTLL